MNIHLIKMNNQWKVREILHEIRFIFKMYELSCLSIFIPYNGIELLLLSWLMVMLNIYYLQLFSNCLDPSVAFQFSSIDATPLNCRIEDTFNSRSQIWITIYNQLTLAVICIFSACWGCFFGLSVRYVRLFEWRYWQRFRRT